VIPCEPLADDLANRTVEPVKVVQRFSVLVLSVVIAVHLFVDIPEQVERLYADVRALQSTLQQTPEILHAVRVDLAANVFDTWSTT